MGSGNRCGMEQVCFTPNVPHTRIRALTTPRKAECKWIQNVFIKDLNKPQRRLSAFLILQQVLNQHDIPPVLPSA